MKFFFLLLAALLCVACGNPTPLSVTGDPLSLRYASLLSIHKTDSFITADVLDAWRPGHVMQRYVLVPRSRPLPSRLPDGTLVRTPLQRAAAFSSVHACLLYDLQQLPSIAALCDVDYLQHAHLRHAVAQGLVADLGEAMQPDVEKLVALQTDALLVSPFENAGHGAISHTGIPIIECADYMEASPLARAEWMRFFGLLFGCEERADSLFAEVEHHYNALAEKAAGAERRPKLLCDLQSGSTWYVPGGGSTLGRLFADAGADYAFARRPESGSVALSFEHVYAAARDADVWLIKYGAGADFTYASLAADYRPYTQFAPWRERHIHGCNTFNVPYYEETPFRPDRLLRDLVRILHPELLPDHRLRYYRPLGQNPAER